MSKSVLFANEHTTKSNIFPLGHYSYECTKAKQDRPYISRPSRTQQILNPKLMPKLNNDVLEEETKPSK